MLLAYYRIYLSHALRACLLRQTSLRGVPGNYTDWQSAAVLIAPPLIFALLKWEVALPDATGGFLGNFVITYLVYYLLTGYRITANLLMVSAFTDATFLVVYAVSPMTQDSALLLRSLFGLWELVIVGRTIYINQKNPVGDKP